MKQMIKKVLREKFTSLDIFRRYWRFYLMPSRKYPVELKKFFYKMTGLELNLENPERFIEKVQWRKIFDNNQLYSLLSDKYCVREWVKNKIGEEYLIPLLGVWKTPNEIDFRCLPDSFVLKTNNGCATNIIVRDKYQLDEKEAKIKLKIWLKEPFWYNYGFEFQYEKIPPLIIAEQFMQSGDGNEDLSDYKFFCFKGKPMFCQVIKNRTKGETIDFFNMNWEHQDFIGMNPKGKNSAEVPQKPFSFESMLNIATKLSEGFEFVRVDLYEINKKVYFGEMTFTPGSGIGRFTPDEWDFYLGTLWDITVPQVNEQLVRF